MYFSKIPRARRQKNTCLRNGYRASRNERSFASVSTETNIGKDMFIERFTKRRRTRGKKDGKIRKSRESYVKCFLGSNPPNISILACLCLVLHIVCIHEIETRCLIFS
jgi:hypothetical protein